MKNKQIAMKHNLTNPIVLLLALYLGSARSGIGYTLNFFPASTYDANTATMNTALGISGFIIEDFEDTTLIPGLSITYTYADSHDTTQSSLPRVLSLSGNWDGVAVAINDPANNPPQNKFGYPIRTTFTYSLGASSMGIGLGGFQSLSLPLDQYPITDHRLLINGVALSQTLESLAGADWTASWLDRDVYLRVDAGPNETLTSIGFENIQPGALDDDVLHFDHLAVTQVPEPSGYAMLGLGILLLWKQLRRTKETRA